jgi:hypothetical protein
MMDEQHFPRISAAEPTSVAIITLGCGTSGPDGVVEAGTAAMRSSQRGHRHFALIASGLPGEGKKHSLRVHLSQKSCNITVVGEGDLTSPRRPFGYLDRFRANAHPLGVWVCHGAKCTTRQ